MFHWNKTRFNRFQILKLKAAGKYSYFSVIPDYGGCLNELVIEGKELLTAAKSEGDIRSLTINSFMMI